MNCEEYQVRSLLVFLTCWGPNEDYVQELPLDERSPDDQKAIQLMRASYFCILSAELDSMLTVLSRRSTGGGALNAPLVSTRFPAYSFC